MRRIPWILFFAMAVLLLEGCRPKVTRFTFEPLDVGSDPVQAACDDAAAWTLRAGGFTVTVTPKADYTVRGIVLSTRRYRHDRNAVLSPCDVALAWGKMADGDVLNEVSWDQSGRWYWWSYDSDFPFDNATIARYSANTHVIPSTPNVRRAVLGLDAGDRVSLSGQLVFVDATDGSSTWWWHSSLSREDTGEGSCEVLFLRSLEVDGRVYE
ncbi:MAG: hypothetical protein AB1347_04070 [Acidobacteriota bacterium]